MLERLFPQQADDRLVVEDVFSTWLYTGNGSSQTITNGIDLAGKGGLVWVKGRSTAGYYHVLVDTVRGASKPIYTNDTLPQQNSGTQGINGFLSTGFSLGTDSQGNVNTSSQAFVSWTFRKEPKFFDIVTWTGNNANRDIAHNLGVEPGMMLVKRTSGANVDWAIYHISRGSTQYGIFTSAAFLINATTFWNSTTPTATNIRIGTNSQVNASGETYVAYLFAHDPSVDGLIQCGSYTGNGSTSGPTLNLGWEPQWVMIKNASLTGNWHVVDNMRGMPVGSADTDLIPNSNIAEQVFDWISPTATGFQITTSGVEFNQSGQTYIYIAIRRGPMRTPTLGTSVFAPVVYTGTNLDNRLVNTGILTDMFMGRVRVYEPGQVPDEAWATGDRLRGNPFLVPTSTAAQNTDPDVYMTPTLGVGNAFSAMNGVGVGNDIGASLNFNTTANNTVAYAFRRAPGFFDVVCYTGSNSDITIPHNLTVKPELIIVKARNNVRDWAVILPSIVTGTSSGTNFSTGLLNRTNALIRRNYGGDSWLTQDVTSTNLFFEGNAAGGNAEINFGGWTYVAYLFASVPGVSKVGTYTGNGSSQTINCGFTNGARFILIKRTDSTGDWYVWDSARGITLAQDPILSLNTNGLETSEWDAIDPDSTGFVVNQTATININVNGATYIYLAIA